MHLSTLHFSVKQTFVGDGLSSDHWIFPLHQHHLHHSCHHEEDPSSPPGPSRAHANHL